MKIGHIGVVICLLFCAGFRTFGYEATVNGITWEYDVSSDWGDAGSQYGAVITGFSKGDVYSGDLTGPVTVPASLGGYTVRYCWLDGGPGITSLSLPNTLQEVHLYGFESITSLSVPSSCLVLEIDGCAAVTSLTVPSGCVDLSIWDCTALTSLYIPASVYYLYVSGLSNVSAYSVDSRNTEYSSDSAGLLYNKSKTTLYEIPGTATAITIPASVRKISGAFDSCKRLNSIGLASGNSSFTLRDGVLYTSDLRMLVAAPRNIVEIDVPDSVLEIGSCAFKKCKSLVSVRMPRTMQSLGVSAFYGCSSLRAVRMPLTLSTMGSSCFASCVALENISIPSGITEVPNSCFLGCTELRSIFSPQTVTKLGSTCFYGCTNLRGANINQNLQDCGSSCFRGCTALQSIVWPSASLSSGSFNGCSALTAFYSTAASCPSTRPSDVFGANDYKHVTVYAPWTRLSYEWTCRSWTPSWVTTYFYANGGEVVEGSRSYVAGQPYGGLPIPFRAGYDFVGWFTSASGGYEITAFDTASSRSLYAHWNMQSTRVTVTFKANGGSGTMASQTFMTGVSQALNVNQFTRSGYLFKGWARNSGDSWPDYYDGEWVELEADLKLYAVWEPEPTYYWDGKYKWYYEIEGGSARIYGVNPIPSGRIAVPGLVDGYKVKRLGCGPCMDSRMELKFLNVNAFELPSSLKFLDRGDFEDSDWWYAQSGPVAVCGEWAIGVKSSVSKLTVPAGVRKIAVNFALDYWGAIRFASVSLPEGLTHICAQAFWGQDQLRDVRIPASVTAIGDYAFADVPGPFYFLGAQPTVTDCTGLTDMAMNEVFGWIEEDDDRVIYFRRGAAGWTDGGTWCGLPTYAWDPPPTGVASVSATKGTYSDRIRVSWSRVPGANGYQIYRSPNWMATGAASLVATIRDEQTVAWDDANVPYAGSSHTYSYYVVVGTDNASSYNFGILAEAGCGSDSGWRTGIPVTVTLRPNGGSCSQSSVVVYEGDTYRSLPTPIRDGYYDFNGWHTALIGGDLVGPGTPVSASVRELYAHWSVSDRWAEDWVRGNLDRVNYGGDEVRATISQNCEPDYDVRVGDGLSLRLSQSESAFNPSVSIRLSGIPKSYFSTDREVGVSFQWKTSSESGYDWLKLYVNGTEWDRISGETEWQTVFIPFSASSSGELSLEIRYEKDGSVDRGQDCGWIGGLGIRINGGSNPESLPLQNGLSFTSGGNSAWTVFSDVGWKACSGVIKDNQASWIETVVHGAGTLTFDWFVSSETGDFDYLEVLVHGVRQGKISGTGSAWRSETIEIGRGGAHAIRWNYRKDGSVSAGDDCGWLSNVRWTPATLTAYDSDCTYSYVIGENDNVLLTDVAIPSGRTLLRLPSSLNGRRVYGVEDGFMAGYRGSVTSVDCHWGEDWHYIGRGAFANSSIQTCSIKGHGPFFVGQEVLAGCGLDDVTDGIAYFTPRKLQLLSRTALRAVRDFEDRQLPLNGYVAGIAPHAFENSSCATVVVPESVTWIGKDAFAGCKGPFVFDGAPPVVMDDFGREMDPSGMEGVFGTCVSSDSRVVYFADPNAGWTDGGRWCGLRTVYDASLHEKVTIKFKANGGTVSEPSRQCILGRKIGTLPLPQYESMNFVGWYTAAEEGEQVTDTTVVDGSFTKLYAHWASRKGSSRESAKALTVGPEEKSRAFTLTEEYDDEEQRGTGSGAYYHKVTLEKGKAYTFCLTDASEDCWLDVFTDWDDPTFAYFEYEWCAGIQAAFLYPDAWDKDDPYHATFYVRVQGAVGDTAVLHYSEGIVTDFFPKGSYPNPKVINDTKIDHSRPLIDGECWFSVWLDAGEAYSVAVRDDGTNGLKLDCEEDDGLAVVRRSDTALELRSDTSRYVMVYASGKEDREFLFTSTKAFYRLTFDSAGGSPVEPFRYGYGLPMDDLPASVREGYRFVRWRFAADNAKVKATTLMPAADTALVAQWMELGRPYFVTTAPKVYEDAGYAELEVVRTSGEGALSVRWTTADLTAFAGVDYVASEGILSWAQDDMEAKTIRVKLIPDLVGRYEVSKRFTVSLSPLPAAEAASRGEYVAVLGDAATATVKVKNVDERSVGTVAVVGEPLVVTAGGTLCVRVARTGGDDGRIAVTVKTQPGTALADVDYVHVSKTLVWENGEDGEQEFVVDTLDAKGADAKTFNVKLTALAEWKGETLDVPATPVRKAYVTLNGTAEPPPATKASFTVTGPGIFTAEPYIAAGLGILKYKTTGGWTPVPSGKTFNLSVPAGETTVQFKIASASPDARLAFVKQIRDRDYRFVSLTNPAYLQVAADGSLVDSKGREIWIEQTFELTQGVFTGVVVPELAAEDDVELVGGSVPPGMNSQLGIPLCGPDGWCLSLIRGIVGVPIKAKDYVAVFRITAGENKKRIAILTFKVKAADLDFGNYFGVLRTEDSVSDFSQLGWFKYSVAADGTVSAKATVGGIKYRFTNDGFEKNEDSRIPGVWVTSRDGDLWIDLVVRDGRATVDFGYGLPTYSCELHRAEADLADFAGYYTLALVPTDCCWREPPCGNGYLALTVGSDGSVVTAGKFPDGTDFTASSVAYRAGDALEIPVFAAVAPWSFGGVLRIRPDHTVELGKSYDASVFDSFAALDWYGSPFGYGSALRLVPAGGYYNTVFNLQTYYLNRDFSIDAEGAPETALELVGNAFGPNATNTKLTFARETGIVSGKFDNWQTGTRVKYYGVVPMYRDGASPLSASVWATGFYLLPQPDGSVESKPFAITAE